MAKHTLPRSPGGRMIPAVIATVLLTAGGVAAALTGAFDGRSDAGSAPVRPSFTAAPTDGTSASATAQRSGAATAPVSTTTTRALSSPSPTPVSPPGTDPTGLDAPCPVRPVLRVVAAPGIASVLRGAAASTCVDLRLTVDDHDSFAAAADLRAGRVDAWVPDSRVRAAVLGDRAVRSARSLATSPIVMAVPSAYAHRMAPTGRASWAMMLDPGALPAAVEVQDPATSSTGLILADALSGLAQSRLGDEYLGLAATAGVLGDVSVAPAAYSGRAIRLAEARTVRHTSGTTILPMVEGDPTLDYPVLGGASMTSSARLAEAELEAAVLGAPGNRARSSAGLLAPRATSFTATRGARSSALLPGPTVDTLPLLYALAGAGTSADNDLFVVDVSGSMGDRPRGGGRPVFETVRSSLNVALHNLPDATRVGVWEFGYRLRGSSDHREVVVPGRLGDRRTAMLTRIGGMRPGSTGTSLNRTVLDAYRYMLAHYRPGRHNVVAVFTDGRDEDAPGRIDEARLRRELLAARDPRRLVTLLFFAIGNADRPAMRRIVEVTGGGVQPITDPNQILGVLIASAAAPVR